LVALHATSPSSADIRYAAQQGERLRRIGVLTYGAETLTSTAGAYSFSFQIGACWKKRGGMMKMNYLIYALTLTLMAIGGAEAQSPSSSAVPVTVENFVRAESDFYFGLFVNLGGFGKFFHRRELVPVDRHAVRPNRDTLYSEAVFDLDAGAVTISLPNAGNRYMSMQVIDEDQFTQSAIYGAGSYTFSREKAYTRYIFVLVRTLVDPTNPKDLEEVLHSVVTN
jgi:hypothetical protein